MSAARAYHLRRQLHVIHPGPGACLLLNSDTLTYSTASPLLPRLCTKHMRTCYDPCSGAFCGGCCQLLLAEGLQQVLVGCTFCSGWCCWCCCCCLGCC
jgi:hypothetical protein